MKNVTAVILLLGLVVGQTQRVRALCVDADREGYCVVETDAPDAGDEAAAVEDE